MIDGSEKRNRPLAFELQNSHVCEKRSKQNFKTFQKNGFLTFLYILPVLILKLILLVKMIYKLKLRSCRTKSKHFHQCLHIRI